jgi:hypothetical protein
MTAVPWLEVKAFVDFGHSSDRHLLQSGYLGMARGPLLVLCIDYAPPNHSVVYLAEGMGTLMMSYSFAMIRETPQQVKSTNPHLVDQVKASEKVY